MNAITIILAANLIGISPGELATATGRKCQHCGNETVGVRVVFELAHMPLFEDIKTDECEKFETVIKPLAGDKNKIYYGIFYNDNLMLVREIYPPNSPKGNRQEWARGTALTGVLAGREVFVRSRFLKETNTSVAKGCRIDGEAVVLGVVRRPLTECRAIWKRFAKEIAQTESAYAKLPKDRQRTFPYWRRVQDKASQIGKDVELGPEAFQSLIILAWRDGWAAGSPDDSKAADKLVGRILQSLTDENDHSIDNLDYLNRIGMIVFGQDDMTDP